MDSLNLRQSIFIALICLIGYAIVRQIIYSVETSKFKRLHGCKPPTRLPQLDPILGLDLFKTIKQNAAERKALETNVRRSLTVARTMTINLMGQTFVSTCEPENVKAILATNFDDFVVGPRMSALGRLMGRGIFTTDGVHWEHSRVCQLESDAELEAKFDYRPLFGQVSPGAQVADLDSIETHLQNLIKKLPEDGATVDMQHLFFNFTIDNATEFLLGRSINCQIDPSIEYFSEAWDYAESRSNDRLWLGKLAFLMRDAKFESSCDIVHSVVDNYIAEFLSTKKGGATLGSGEVKAKRYNLLSELSAFSDGRNLLSHVCGAASFFEFEERWNEAHPQEGKFFERIIFVMTMRTAVDDMTIRNTLRQTPVNNKERSWNCQTWIGDGLKRLQDAKLLREANTVSAADQMVDVLLEAPDEE
ncbi:hypothetical protein VE02_05687 [Pseudogymnoascus sp. 03VT05]|nr:hypothetical protein VE02_05687 [Pseudogymnoascus sp. 03VT05]